MVLSHGHFTPFRSTSGPLAEIQRVAIELAARPRLPITIRNVHGVGVLPQRVHVRAELSRRLGLLEHVAGADREELRFVGGNRYRRIVVSAAIVVPGDPTRGMSTNPIKVYAWVGFVVKWTIIIQFAQGCAEELFSLPPLGPQLVLLAIVVALYEAYKIWRWV